MPGLLVWLAARSKAAVALLGVAAEVVVAGGLQDRYPWAAVVVALATALGVYAAPNRSAASAASRRGTPLPPYPKEPSA